MSGTAILWLVIPHRPQIAALPPAAAWPPPQQPADAPDPGFAAPPAAVVHANPDELARNLLAAYNEVGNAMASVVDSTSADAQAVRIATNVRRMIELATQLDDAELSAEEDKRLHAQYDGPLQAAKTRINNEMVRVKSNPGAAAALGRRLHWEDLKQGISHLAIRSRRKAQRRGPVQALAQALASDAPLQPFASMAPNQMAVVVVDNLPGDLVTYLCKHLKDLAGAGSYQGSGSGRTMTATLGSVSDLHGLAAKIDFGKVTRVDDTRRMIFVWADASKLPQPLGPPVRNPLAPDFYRQNLVDLRSWDRHRAQEAAKRLKTAQPKEFRAEISAALLNLLSDDDYFLVAAVIDALPAWCAADAAVPKLLDLLGDTRGGVVDAAIGALGKFKDARTIEPILQKTNHHRSTSAAAMRNFGKLAESVLLKYLDDANLDVREAAVYLLGEVGTDKSVPALQSLLQSGAGSPLSHVAQSSLRHIEERQRRARSP